MIITADRDLCCQLPGRVGKKLNRMFKYKFNWSKSEENPERLILSSIRKMSRYLKMQSNMKMIMTWGLGIGKTVRVQ